MIKRVKSKLIQSRKGSHCTKLPVIVNEPTPYNVDLVTCFNWDGLDEYRLIRKSKECVWACRMYFPEGFRATINGREKIGYYGYWLVLINDKKSIMTNKMFRKKFWCITHEE